MLPRGSHAGERPSVSPLLSAPPGPSSPLCTPQLAAAQGGPQPWHPGGGSAASGWGTGQGAQICGQSSTQPPPDPQLCSSIRSAPYVPMHGVGMAPCAHPSAVSTARARVPHKQFQTTALCITVRQETTTWVCWVLPCSTPAACMWFLSLPLPEGAARPRLSCSFPSAIEQFVDFRIALSGLRTAGCIAPAPKILQAGGNKAGSELRTQSSPAWHQCTDDLGEVGHIGYTGDSLTGSRKAVPDPTR